MKAFVVSLSIVLIIFSLTIINSIWVKSATELLIATAEELNIHDGSVENFSQLWEEKQLIIRIASSHEEIHKIDEALAVLKAKVTERDASGFLEEQALLVEYLYQIKEDETVSIDSII